MATLRIKDENGNWIELPAIKGTDGIDGRNGVDGKGISSITRYYLATGPEVIEWDGNTTGRETGYDICKVSDTILSIDELIGLTIEDSNGGSYIIDHSFEYDETWYSVGSDAMTSAYDLITVFTKPTELYYNDENVTLSPGMYFFFYKDYYYITKLIMPPKEVTIDTEGWTTDIQLIDSTNRHLWSYEAIEFTDGTTNISQPVIIGVYGEAGKDGINGINGINGFSPITTIEQTETGATITIIDQNGTTTANITNGIDGKDGVDGKDGFSPVVTATVTETGTTLTITDQNGTTTTTILNGKDGNDGLPGADGIDGKDGLPGADGNGISSITRYYLATDKISGTEVIEWDGDTTGRENYQSFYKVSDKIPNLEKLFGATVDTTFMGTNYSVPIAELRGMGAEENYMAYSNEVSFELALFVTETTENVPLSPGVYFPYIAGMIETTKLTVAGGSISTDEEGWTTEIQTMTPTNKYLWSYEVIEFTDGTTNTSDSVIIGVYGDKGADGQTPDMSIYYTKEETNAAINNAIGTALEGSY